MEGYLIKGNVPEKLIDLQTQVVVGKTSQREIIKKFGEPFISNDLLRVEVYRVIEDSHIYYDIPFPPIFIPQRIDVEIAYALIVYDEHSIVKDIDWGIYHSSDEIFGNTRQIAKLVADGFLFESFEVGGIYTKTEVLFARISDSQQSLHSIAPQGKCLLHIAPGEYESKITLDDEVLASYDTVYSSWYHYPFSHPVSDHGWFLGFVTILIPSGEHTLSITTRKLKPSEFKIKFSCGSGRKLYAYTDIEKYQWTDKMSWEGSYRYRGEIVISDTLPEVFEDRRLILYHGDKWLAPD